MPDGQPVEADRTLEERQSREQEHLDEGEVAREERGEPPSANQGGVEAVPVVAEVVSAAGTPDRNDRGSVARQEDPDRDQAPATPPASDANRQNLAEGSRGDVPGRHRSGCGSPVSD